MIIYTLRSYLAVRRDVEVELFVCGFAAISPGSCNSITAAASGSSVPTSIVRRSV